MAPRPVVIRRAAGLDDDPLESQFWPATILLLVFAGVVTGLIIARSDFYSPHVLHNAWFHLFVNTVLVGVLMWASSQLRGKVLMRVQISVLLSLLMHLVLLIGFMTVNVPSSVLAKKPASDKLSREDLVTLPDYGVPVQQFQEEQPFEKPVETPEPQEQVEKPQKTPVEHPQPETQKPTTEPQKSETTTPAKVQMERAETSASRPSETLAGAQLSRQSLKLPESPQQHVPTPQVNSKPESQSQATASPSTVVNRSTSQPQAQSRPTQADEPSTPTHRETVEMKRQPSANQPTTNARPAPQMARQPSEVPPLKTPQPNASQMAQSSTSAPSNPASSSSSAAASSSAANSAAASTQTPQPPSPLQPSSLSVTRAAASSVQPSTSNAPNQLTQTNTAPSATAPQRATADQATSAQSSATTATAPQLSRSTAKPQPTTSTAAVQPTPTSAAASKATATLEASSSTAANTRTAQATPTASPSQTTSPSPTTATSATANQAARATASSQQPTANSAAAPAQMARSTNSAPSSTTVASAPAATASSPARTSPTLEASATQVARSQPSAVPAAANSPNQATQVAQAGSNASATSAEVQRVQRTSSPSAVPSSQQQSLISRNQGETHPAPSTAQVAAPAVAEASKSSELSPAASSLQLTRSQTGTSGMTSERNFSQSAAASSTVSQSTVASAAAQRTATQSDAPSQAANPSRSSTMARAAAGQESPQAALKAESVKVADAAGSRQPAEVEASASAATRTAAAKAPNSKVQAEAGSSALDLAASQTIPAAGESRGAASPGSGEPALAMSNQPATPGRATSAGEPQAATAAPQVTALTATPGNDPSSLAGPSMNSQASQATRQNNSTPQPGTSGGPAQTAPSASLTGVASSVSGATSRSEAQPTTTSSGGGQPTREVGQLASAAGAKVDTSNLTEGTAGVSGQTASKTEASVADVGRAGPGAPVVSSGSTSADTSAAASGTLGQAASAVARSSGDSGEPSPSMEAGGAANLARSSTSGGPMGAAKVAAETTAAAESGATQTASVEAAAAGLTRQASTASLANGPAGEASSAPSLSGANQLSSGSGPARADQNDQAAPGQSTSTASLGRTGRNGDLLASLTGSTGKVETDTPSTTTPGNNNSPTGGVEAGQTAVARQETGQPGGPIQRTGEAVPGSPGNESAGVQADAGSPGPRNRSREDSPNLAMTGEGQQEGMPARKQGSLNLPSGVTAIDDPGLFTARTGPEPGGEGLQAAPGLDSPTRQASGMPVQVAAAEGPGGLASNPSAMIGMPDHRASRQSEVVQQSTARFVLERSQGRLKIDTQSVANSVPTFVLRKSDTRKQAAQLFGSTPEAEQAVEMALDFLARHQMADGSWHLHDFAPDEPGYENAGVGRVQSNTAATGLALLAFLGAGYDHQDGKYRLVVERGLQWLIKHQRSDGDLFSEVGGSPAVWLYSHGIATLPLCEAYGMTADPQLREPVQKALQFILHAQDPKRGGWRYQPQEESDTSVSGWQMMALKSGEISGFVVPESSYAGINKWLDYATTGPGGGASRYAYMPIKNPPRAQAHYPIVSKVMTAEALLMRMYLGWNREHPAVKDGGDYILRNLPPRTMYENGQRDTYYWYYATQVMFQMQGSHWKVWNDRLRDLLVNSQEKRGVMAGSWDPVRPTPDKWGVLGGRVYVTCMHVLMLEVYYRHLPLFRLGDEAADNP